jgi:hypothetical protein
MNRWAVFGKFCAWVLLMVPALAVYFAAFDNMLGHPTLYKVGMSLSALWILSTYNVFCIEWLSGHLPYKEKDK